MCMIIAAHPVINCPFGHERLWAKTVAQEPPRASANTRGAWKLHSSLPGSITNVALSRLLRGTCWSRLVSEQEFDPFWSTEKVREASGISSWLGAGGRASASAASAKVCPNTAFCWIRRVEAAELKPGVWQEYFTNLFGKRWMMKLRGEVEIALQSFFMVWALWWIKAWFWALHRHPVSPLSEVCLHQGAFVRPIENWQWQWLASSSFLMTKSSAGIPRWWKSWGTQGTMHLQCPNSSTNHTEWCSHISEREILINGIQYPQE